MDVGEKRHQVGPRKGSHGVVVIYLTVFQGVSPFFRRVQKGIQKFASGQVRLGPFSLFTWCGCISRSVVFPYESVHVSRSCRKKFCIV